MNAMSGRISAMPSNSGVAQVAADVLPLASVLGSLWRRKITLSFAAMIGAVLGAVWISTIAVPYYSATTVLVMKPQLDQIVDLGGVVPGLAGDDTAVNTEVEVLRSRSLLASVAGMLDLTEDPEFNPALRPLGPIDRALEKAKASLTDYLGAARTMDVATSGSAMTATVDSLREAITVRNVPDSLVFEVLAESPDPKKAADISNTLAERYIERQIEVKFTATEQATGWLSQRVAELKLELEKAEKEAKAFAAKMELINPETLDALADELSEVRDRIIARESAMTRGASVSRSRRQLVELRRMEAELSEKITKQSQGLVTLEQLQREAEADRLIYEYFLSRLKETSVQQGIQQADSTILSWAEVPEIAARPRPALVTLMSAVLALALVSIRILKTEAERSSFRNAEELEERTGYTVLGQIPKIPARRRRSVLAYVLDRPTSAAVEAIRNLRTTVFMASAEPPRVIMLTSSVPGEGKTTQALALAHNLAGLGKRVLLIEGDIRRRMFGSYFDVGNRPGLVAVVRGKTGLADAAWSHKKLGIDILAGENSKINAADLFSSAPFADLVAAARATYDVVIIDSPPVLVVPDARVIGQFADAILYVVHWDRTRERQVLQGLKSFETVGAKVAGLVLSKIDARGLKRYGYGECFDTQGYYQN